MLRSFHRLLTGVGILLLAGLPNAVTGQPHAPHYRIVSQSERGLTLEFHFETLEVAETPSSPRLKRFSIPGLAQNQTPGEPLLPVLSLPLALPRGSHSTHLRVIESEHFAGQFPNRFVDRPATEVPGSAPLDNSGRRGGQLTAGDQPFTAPFPSQPATLGELGVYRDTRLHALRVFPLQVTSDGTRLLKRFTVEIRFQGNTRPARGLAAGERSAVERLIVNDRQIHLVEPVEAAFSDGPVPSGPLTNVTADQRVRIIIAEDGLYRVTGLDLLEAEVNLNDIDPGTLRLENRGAEVAFYLFGDRDGRFNSDDYLEFWGERNERTFLDQYPDQYSDPFTDENVYWLSWGGRPGVRMVDENGSIITDRPGEFNPSFFYETSTHVERNAYFERLGQANEENLSYTRDLWYFDSGIKAVGKKPFSFELEHPDESSFNNVIVDVMMTGKTFGALFDDGIPGNDDRVPHNVQIWLNDGYVGQSPPTWFDQDTARITNRGNSTLRTANLRNGTNQLEVQLPVLPDVTQRIQDENGNTQTVVVKGTDIVLLNWFQVTYDRKYIATDNAIEFRRPSFIPYPNTDLYQFDLERFTRPDIQIYKKGVSRIINYRITEETIDDTAFYKISFQDNVPTDDVEYIALSNSLKKRPLRIERDEPVDAGNPLRTLRDPSNSAEYLIITHRQFYDGAQALAQHRRNQGLASEVVRVQDIYDEFNAGIKSPLAIQSFLRYAFFNWDRSNRLKYVVLLGNANFNYRRNSGVFQDYVPTFFYQTQEFGATASDFPYTLVAGDDEIPDLYVGRIPSTSSSDVNNVVAKLIEYDQAGVVDAWRSRGLFISGNDAATYELFTRDPAFRTQNSRVIESLHPNHLSARRLNTVRDPDVDFDPNFGNDTDLIDAWDDGLFWINFMGHGGGGIWADVQLMDLDDVDRLNNRGRYPFVTSMTCFTGAFENPNNLGLAQKLVLTPERGAIGVLASSGLGWLHNDYTMLWNMGQFMFVPDASIGEIITLGKILYFSNGNRYYGNFGTPGFSSLRHEMVYQYNFLGDPATVLTYTREGIDLTLSTSTPQRGDTVGVTISSPVSVGDGYLELADRDYNVLNRIPLFGVSDGSQLSITIPGDFPEGTGLIRAYLSDGSRDAAGEARLGVSYAALNAIAIEPANPDVDDTVTVRLTLTDANGIERVWLFEDNGSRDTLFATGPPGTSGEYVAQVPPTGRLETVFFHVYVENAVGNISVFNNQRYTVTDVRPDLAADAGSLGFAGTRSTQLRLGVENLAGAGDDGTVQAVARFFDGETNFTNGTPFASRVFPMTASDSTTVSVDFPLDLDRPSFTIYATVEVAPGEGVDDFNPSNNTVSATLIPTIFTIAPGRSDTIVAGSAYRVVFPAGSISDTAAVEVREVAVATPGDQRGLDRVPIGAIDQFPGLSVVVRNPGARIQFPYQVDVQLDPALLESAGLGLFDVSLYHKRNSGAPWLSTNAYPSDSTGTIRTAIGESGRIAPFRNLDRAAPRIELTADGRPFKSGGEGLVGANPSLYVIVEDESGLNLDRETIALTLDGNAIPQDKIFFPDSVLQNNALGITIYPELADGEHRLEVTAQDVNGNVARNDFLLQVSDEFELRVYGNYPNPFRDQTIFSYFINLNDDLDAFEIRIYTVSGRLIRRIDSDINNPIDAIDGGARRKGYNELIWDGRDKNGNEVANGVYFAVVRAEYDGQTIEETLKVAKLR